MSNCKMYKEDYYEYQRTNKDIIDKQEKEAEEVEAKIRERVYIGHRDGS